MKCSLNNRILLVQNTHQHSEGESMISLLLAESSMGAGIGIAGAIIGVGLIVLGAALEWVKL